MKLKMSAVWINIFAQTTDSNNTATLIACSVTLKAANANSSSIQ